MGFTYDAMLDAILITNTSKHANYASMALGWFKVDLVTNLLLVAPLSFGPCQNLGTSPHFSFGIDFVAALDET